MRFVADTNVLVVADGRSAQASRACVAACAVRLQSITRGKAKIVLDEGWRILREYARNLSQTGQGGAGSSFFAWVLRNRSNADRCELVTIHPTDMDGTDFAEFPEDPGLAAFDPSNRKFVAVALAHPDRPPILQAVDRRWWELRGILRRNGVSVEFLCEADIQAQRQS